MIHNRFGGSGRSDRLCEKAPPPQEEHLSMRCVKPLDLADLQQLIPTTLQTLLRDSLTSLLK